MNEPVVGRQVRARRVSHNETAFRFLCFMIVSTLLHLGGRLAFLGAIRIDLLLAIATLALAWTSRPSATPGWKPDPFEQTVSRRLYLLFGYIVVTLPFVEWPGSVIKNGMGPFFSAVIFFWLIIWCVKTPRAIIIFLYLFVACQTFRILEPLVLHLTSGYWGSAAYLGGGEFMERLSGAPHDTINPNGLAYLVVITVPMIYFMAQLRGWVVKLLCWALIGLAVYALLLTGSRSGLLVFGFLVVLWIWTSRYRAVAIVAVVVSVMLVTPVLTDLQRDRYLSIFSSDTRSGATSEGRINALSQDLTVAMRRPLFGHGLSTSKEANAHFRGYAQISHNLYTEVAQELGFVGLAIFLSVIVAVVRAAAHSLRVLRAQLSGGNDDPQLRLVGRCILILLTVNIVFSFASYGLFDPTWYLLSGLAVVAARLAAQAAKQPPQPASVRSQRHNAST